MDPQIDHLIMASYRLWLDNRILKKGNAYTNKVDFPLYEETKNDHFLDYTTYWSQDYQWVYDSSIVGATIPTGISDGGSPISRGTDGLKIDFEKGRAIFNSGHSAETDYTVSCSVKDINTYLVSDPDEKLIFNTQFDRAPTLKTPNTGTNPYQYLAPCVFIKTKKTENEPAGLGGKDWTKIKVRNVIFADEWNLVGLESILRDSNLTCFPYLDADDLPFNEFGDLKDGSFDYDAVASTYTDGDRLVFIDSVEFSIYNGEELSERSPDLRLAFADFELSIGRDPRA